MRYGVTLQAVAEPAEFVELVRWIERLGYHDLWVGDSSLHCGDAYVYATLALQATSRLRVGTSVTNPLTRHNRHHRQRLPLAPPARRRPGGVRDRGRREAVDRAGLLQGQAVDPRRAHGRHAAAVAGRDRGRPDRAAAAGGIAPAVSRRPHPHLRVGLWSPHARDRGAGTPTASSCWWGSLAGTAATGSRTPPAGAAQQHRGPLRDRVLPLRGGRRQRAGCHRGGSRHRGVAGQGVAAGGAGCGHARGSDRGDRRQLQRPRVPGGPPGRRRRARPGRCSRWPSQAAASTPRTSWPGSIRPGSTPSISGLWPRIPARPSRPWPRSPDWKPTG